MPALTGNAAWLTHAWRWRQTRYGPLASVLAQRAGQPCRVFARGMNGSVGVEFADGYRVVAPRFAVARLRSAEDERVGDAEAAVDRDRLARDEVRSA
jgi:hypothetical protein